MSLQIGKNQNIALSSKHDLGLQTQKMDKSIDSLASGQSKKVDDTTLSMISQLSSGISGSEQSILNANETIGMLQIADGALVGFSNALFEMQTLSTQASSGMMNSNDLENLQKHMNSLLSSSDKLVSSAQYNGKNLLDGSLGQSGENGALFSKDMRASSILKDGLDISTPEAARESMEKITLARESVDSTRSSFSSNQNKLYSEIMKDSFFQINSASSKSNLKDVDFALESKNFSNSKLLNESVSFALAQQNVASSSVLALLG